MEYSAIEKYDSRDFIEEMAWKEWGKVAKTFSNIKYNQKLVDSYSCTGQAACGAISDVTGYALPLSFRKKVWERQLETGAIPWRGDYLQNWVKQAVKLFNEENPELPYKLAYYRVEKVRNIDIMMNVLNESSVVTWYTASFKVDSQDNWIIDNIDNPDGGGHAIRIVKGTRKWKSLTVKYCDNYEGILKYNIIEIPSFEKNQDFFWGGYYIKKINK